jgi:hypothetical protein
MANNGGFAALASEACRPVLGNVANTQKEQSTNWGGASKQPKFKRRKSVVPSAAGINLGAFYNNLDMKPLKLKHKVASKSIKTDVSTPSKSLYASSRGVCSAFLDAGTSAVLPSKLQTSPTRKHDQLSQDSTSRHVSSSSQKDVPEAKQSNKVQKLDATGSKVRPPSEGNLETQDGTILESKIQPMFI